MEQFNHWIKVSQPGFSAHWQVHSVSLVTVMCRLCWCFTLDLTQDWRLNLDVCGHTLWVFDSLRLGIRNLLKIQRLQRWRFEPSETFKASELNTKISRRAAEWYIGTYLSSFGLLRWSLLRLAPALAHSDWLTQRVNRMPLKNGAFGIGICRKGKRNVVIQNRKPETTNRWNISFFLLYFKFLLYLQCSPEKWDASIHLDLLMCAVSSSLHNVSYDGTESHECTIYIKKVKKFCDWGWQLSKLSTLAFIRRLLNF